MTKNTPNTNNANHLISLSRGGRDYLIGYHRSLHHIGNVPTTWELAPAHYINIHQPVEKVLDDIIRALTTTPPACKLNQP